MLPCILKIKKQKLSSQYHFAIDFRIKSTLGYLKIITVVNVSKSLRFNPFSFSNLYTFECNNAADAVWCSIATLSVLPFSPAHFFKNSVLIKRWEGHHTFTSLITI